MGTVPFGFDHGLHIQRVTTAADASQGSLPYVVTVDPGTGTYVLGIECERVAGVAAQRFGVNDGGPLSLNWLGNAAGGYYVQLLTDWRTRQAPGTGCYTWVVLMERADYTAGPFPRPDKWHTSFTMRHNVDIAPGAGGVRTLVGATFTYNGIIHTVEIDLEEIGDWGHLTPREPDITGATLSADGRSLFVCLDGRALGLGLAPGGGWQDITVDWNEIIPGLMARTPVVYGGAHVLDRPTDWAGVQSLVFYVGHEVHTINLNGVVSDLWVAHLRHDGEA